MNKYNMENGNADLIYFYITSIMLKILYLKKGDEYGIVCTRPDRAACLTDTFDDGGM